MAISGWSVGAYASVALVTVGLRSRESWTDGDENSERPEIAAADLLPEQLQFSARSAEGLCAA
jgi:hypothetical protein